jgi:hypothetical protein
VVFPHEMNIASMHAATQGVRDTVSSVLPKDQVRAYVQSLHAHP